MVLPCGGITTKKETVLFYNTDHLCMLSEHRNEIKLNVKRNDWSNDERFSCELNQPSLFIPKLTFVDDLSLKKTGCVGVKTTRCHEDTHGVTKEETRKGVKYRKQHSAVLTQIKRSPIKNNVRHGVVVLRGVPQM